MRSLCVFTPEMCVCVCVSTLESFLVFGINFDEVEKPSGTLFESPKNNVEVFKNELSVLNTQVSRYAMLLDFLEDTIEGRDFSDTTDTLVNFITASYKIGSLFGVDIDECFAEVHRSNMTKLCKTENEAQITVSDYIRKKEVRDKMLEEATSDEQKEEIHKTNKAYEDPGHREAPLAQYWVVYDQKTSKILKSINFENPKLADVLNLPRDE